MIPDVLFFLARLKVIIKLKKMSETLSRQLSIFLVTL